MGESQLPIGINSQPLSQGIGPTQDQTVSTVTTLNSTAYNATLKTQMVFDTSNNLYELLTDSAGTNYLYKTTPAGVSTSFCNISSVFSIQSIDNITAMVIDSSNNLFFLGQAASGQVSVYKVTSTGVLSTLAAVGAAFLASFANLVIDSVGNLYCAVFSTIYKITPAGAVSQYSTTVTGIYLSLDNNNNLFASQPFGVVSRISSSGVATTISSIFGSVFTLSDNEGSLYVFSQTTSSFVSTVTVTKFLFAGSSLGATFASFSSPGLSIYPLEACFDSSNNLYTTFQNGTIYVTSPSGVSQLYYTNTSPAITYSLAISEDVLYIVQSGVASNLITQKIVSVFGAMSYTFQSPPNGLTWTGTLQCPTAPTDATFTISIGGVGWGSFAGNSVYGPVQVIGQQQVKISVDGLDSITGYEMYFLGSSDVSSNVAAIWPDTNVSSFQLSLSSEVLTTQSFITGGTLQSVANITNPVTVASITNPVTVASITNPVTIKTGTGLSLDTVAYGGQLYASVSCPAIGTPTTLLATPAAGTSYRIHSFGIVPNATATTIVGGVAISDTLGTLAALPVPASLVTGLLSVSGQLNGTIATGALTALQKSSVAQVVYVRYDIVTTPVIS